jgi:ribosomal protein L7Ae-like RNA K-turn-binding protein
VQAAVLAQDADEPIAREVKALCAEHAVPCVTGPGKAALGAACRLQVGAAVAAILK